MGKDVEISTSSRLPSFCLASLGAVGLVAGVIIVVLEVLGENSDDKKLIGYIVSGISGVIFLCGMVWYCIAYKQWKRKKAEQKQKRKLARMQRTNGNGAYVIDGTPCNDTQLTVNEEGYYPGVSYAYQQGQYPMNYAQY